MMACPALGSVLAAAKLGQVPAFCLMRILPPAVTPKLVMWVPGATALSHQPTAVISWRNGLAVAFPDPGFGGSGTNFVAAAPLAVPCLLNPACAAVVVGRTIVVLAFAYGPQIIEWARASRASGKETASDAPSWAAYCPRGPNEKCGAWAARIFLEHYGVGLPDRRAQTGRTVAPTGVSTAFSRVRHSITGENIPSAREIK